MAATPESMVGAMPPPAHVVLDISGMTCAACAARVERALGDVAGVDRATVNLPLERADVTMHASAPAMLVDAVERIGYGAQIRGGSPAERRMAEERLEVARVAAERQTLVLLAVSAALTLPLLLPMIVAPLGFHLHLDPWTELALAVPVQFIVGARFYRGAWTALKAHTGNMDSLVALGTSAAFGFSVAMLWRKGEEATGHLYFEGAAAVITFVILGKWLEARAKRGTTAAIRALMRLRPERARVLRDGAEREVAVEDIQTGDRVVLRPGERAAVDGTVTEGLSEADESLITGESVPVVKRTGDRIVAGSLNGTGRIVVEAVAVGEDTTLARIVRMVENAQGPKAPVQRLVDRIVEIFVPAVIAIALGVFIGWALGGEFEEAVVAAVSVLVIACPCALGLATPAALVAGTGAAARAGILVKDIETLERAARIDVVMFDKTGTLTEGAPALIDIEPAPGIESRDLVRIAAAVQQASEHPLAKAVVSAAAATPDGAHLPAVENFKADVGRGVSGVVGGQKVLIGNRALMREAGVDLAPVEAALARVEAVRTPVVVAVDGAVRGVLGFADQIRAEASEAIRLLEGENVSASMLTGDTERVAETIAAELGLGRRFRAGISPTDKASIVAEETEQGHHVAMVGDGINDAPALAAADVGIAIGSGTDVAVAAAGVTLMRPDPRLVAATIDIARRTVRKIRQNLFWAFVYNVIGIPLAAMGVLTPEVAGAAMALSSVSVVVNSLMLRKWQPKFSRSK